MRKFYGFVFFRVVFQDFRRSSLSFLPQSTPPPGLRSSAELPTAFILFTFEVIIIIFIIIIVSSSSSCSSSIL